MLKLKLQYFGLLMQKNWFILKDPEPGKEWRQEEKGTTEDETVGWHHQLDGHEFDQASGVGDEQGCLAHCSPWGRRESEMTERLNWTELNWQPMPARWSHQSPMFLAKGLAPALSSCEGQEEGALPQNQVLEMLTLELDV